MVDDGVGLRDGLTHQTNGSTQGDNLSPLLFTVLVADLPARIKYKYRNVAEESRGSLLPGAQLFFDALVLN